MLDAKSEANLDSKMAHFESLIALKHTTQPEILIESEVVTNVVPLGIQMAGEDFWTNKIKASLRGETGEGVPRIPTWQDWLCYRGEISDGPRISQEMYEEVRDCLLKLRLDHEYVTKYIMALEKTFGNNQEIDLDQIITVYFPRNKTRVFTIVADNLFEFIPGNYLNQQHDIDSLAGSPYHSIAISKRNNTSDQESPVAKRKKVLPVDVDESGVVSEEVAFAEQGPKILNSRTQVQGEDAEVNLDEVRKMNPIYWKHSIWLKYVKFKETVKEKGWNQLQTVKAFQDYNLEARMEPDELVD